MTWKRFFVRRRRKRRARAGHSHYLAHRELARETILPRLSYWADVLSLTHGRISIRNQGTRWGSCSKKGNLNFNYRLAFLPGELLDYVIVHELCHLREFNHSPAFWKHVEQVLPDYHERKRALRDLSLHQSHDTGTTHPSRR